MTEEIEAPGRRTFALSLAAISAVALLILAIFPARFPSDGDEYFQIGIVRTPAPLVWGAIRSDRYHPPLDYLIDWELERIAPGICERRVPVILWGTLSVALLGLAVRHVAGTRAALAAAALLATSPAFVAECRRLRPYSLGMLSLLLAFVLLQRAVASPTWRKTALVMASAVFSAWSLDLAALFVVVAAALVIGIEALSGVAERRRRALLAAARLAVLAVPAFVACLPLISFLRDAVGHRVMGQAPRLTIGRSLRVVSYAFVSPAAGYGFPPRGLFAAAVMLAVAGLVFGTAVCWRGSSARIFPLWAGAGYVLMEALQRFHPEYDSFRYFLPLVPAMAATIAIGWSALDRKARAPAAALLVIALALAGRSLVRYYRLGQWNFSSGTESPGQRSGARSGEFRRRI